MINFHPKKDKSITSEDHVQSDQQGDFSDLIEVHTRTAIKNHMNVAVNSLDELHKISHDMEINLISLDLSDQIEGFRVLSAYGDNHTTSVFVNIWDAEGKSLVVANNQLHRVGKENALTHVILESNGESYFIAPLMNERFYTEQLLEFSRIATPFICEPSGNILHSILLENFAEYAESNLGFIPTDVKIFWRQPFKSFDIRGAFGSYIASPLWDPNTCSVEFMISSMRA